VEGALERVLRLVAEGRLTAAEAGPILDGLGTAGRSSEGRRAHEADASPGGSTPRFARIEVRDHGKRVVDLRVPVSLGRLALGRVPGLSEEQVTEVEEAVASGARGPILDIEDSDGDGVRIILE
jgi:hypothetical protein